MTLRALLIAAESVARFLARIDLDPNPPPVAPARGPPYFKSPALRRSFGELARESERQLGMFEE